MLNDAGEEVPTITTAGALPEAQLAAAAGSTSEPLRRSFTEKELTDAVMSWMQKRRSEGYEPNPDTYLERIGVLYQFATDLMQNAAGELRPPAAQLKG